MNVILPKSSNYRGTDLEKQVYSFHHEFGSCCLTGFTRFELAHVSGVEDGKGTGRKGPLHLILPLRKELHMIEEMGRNWFWRTVGIDYGEGGRKDYARILYDCIEAREVIQYKNVLYDIQSKANRTFIIDCLKMSTTELEEKWK
ncbi:MAG: hypothetical protein AAF198_06440 [Pseudomonadota bacterium]